MGLLVFGKFVAPKTAEKVVKETKNLYVQARELNRKPTKAEIEREKAEKQRQAAAEKRFEERLCEEKLREKNEEEKNDGIVYDSLGRIVEKQEDDVYTTYYTYYGDTNVVETETCQAQRNHSCVFRGAKGKVIKKISVQKGDVVKWKKYDEQGRTIEDGENPENCVKMCYYKDSKQIETSQKVVDGKVVKTNHYDKNGKDDTIEYLARKRLDEKAPNKKRSALVDSIEMAVMMHRVKKEISKRE